MFVKNIVRPHIILFLMSLLNLFKTMPKRV
jgi:hypothetical protein